MDNTTNADRGASELKGGWSACKNILVIRADNLGDLIMSSPAIRALKETFSAKITVLTSQMATGVAKFIDEIDEVITYDLPWIKTNNAIESEFFFELINQLKQKNFDGAVIFSVFSQNPLPAAMLAYLSNIPRRLAYCRENPYYLLTNWVPDQEPYEFIKHQVERDLALVEKIGAKTTNTKLQLKTTKDAWQQATKTLQEAGIDVASNWFVFHAPVSEPKRAYAVEGWIALGKKLKDKGYNMLLTGTKNEKDLTDKIAEGIGHGAYSIAGLLSLEEFIALIKHTPLVVSVNTGTVHIAAAVGTPLVVLYANTNPQHTPWQVPSKVLYFDVPEEARSKNEVIQFLYRNVYTVKLEMPTADEVMNASLQLLESTKDTPLPPVTETLTAVTD